MTITRRGRRNKKDLNTTETRSKSDRSNYNPPHHAETNNDIKEEDIETIHEEVKQQEKSSSYQKVRKFEQMEDLDGSSESEASSSRTQQKKCEGGTSVCDDDDHETTIRTNAKVEEISESREDLSKEEFLLEKNGQVTFKTFKLQYENIVEMRRERNAPVDSIGCSHLYDEDVSEQEKRYQILLSLMLSAQTKDEVTSKAMKNLRGYGCSMDHMNSDVTSAEKIEKLIYPVSFYKRKAQYIKKVTKICVEKYMHDIPRSIKELCDLPGVGPKMAHLAMTHAWNQNMGIGVDTHVHRISRRLGWTNDLAKTPEHTREQLEKLVPRKDWVEVNELLVGFGQTICKPVGPKCGICKLRNMCLYYQKNGTAVRKPEKKKKKTKIKEHRIDKEEEDLQSQNELEDIENLDSFQTSEHTQQSSTTSLSSFVGKRDRTVKKYNSRSKDKV